MKSLMEKDRSQRLWGFGEMVRQRKHPDSVPREIGQEWCAEVAAYLELRDESEAPTEEAREYVEPISKSPEQD